MRHLDCGDFTPHKVKPLAQVCARYFFFESFIFHINETITTTTTRNVTKSATFFSWQIFRHVTSQCQTSCPKCKSTNMSKANQCASSCCRRHIDTTTATATATATAAAVGQQHVLVDRAWTRTCSHRYYRNVHREVGLSMNIMQLNTRS